MSEIKTLHITVYPMDFPSNVLVVYRLHDEETGLASTSQGVIDEQVSWDQVKTRIPIEATYATECENHLRNCKPVYLGKHEVAYPRRASETAPE
jgi:hypothetical protein